MNMAASEQLPKTSGLVLHKAAFYDLLLSLLTLGRESVFRKRALALARLSAGEYSAGKPENVVIMTMRSLAASNRLAFLYFLNAVANTLQDWLFCISLAITSPIIDHVRTRSRVGAI